MFEARKAHRLVGVGVIGALVASFGVVGPAAAQEVEPTDASGVVASPGVVALEDQPLGAAELVEAITGTHELIYVEPGAQGDSVSIPEDLSDPVVIETEEVAVSFAQPTDVSSEVVVSDEGTVTYRNDEESFDTHLQVLESPDDSLLSDGVRALIEIEDSSAPATYDFEVELPDGAQLVHDEDGMVLGLSEKEEVLLIVPEPWAFDAIGEPVATWYEIDGSKLVQHLDLSDPAITYPVVADPLWFIPIIVAGKAVAKVAVVAATRAAASAATRAIAKSTAAAIATRVAARKVTRIVTGRISRTAFRKCNKGAEIGFAGAAITLYKYDDGKWRYRLDQNGALHLISGAVVTCLAANIK